MGNRTWLVILLAMAVVAILFVTSPGNTGFNHFTLLSDSFTRGKLYIEGNMPWLEKIPIDNSRFYVANPPLPAILAIPFVLFFGPLFPQQYLAHIFAAGLFLVTLSISWEIRKSALLSIWAGVLIIFGTVNWYLATVGSTWYLAHIISQFFLSLAILSKIRGVNLFFQGLLLGASYLTRIPTILAIPFFVKLSRVNLLRNLFKFGLGLLPFILFNFWYNHARFGVIWDIGYTLIPGISFEPWYVKGVVHPSYISEHLRIFLLALPDIPSEFPLGSPSLFGYAIWFTTPSFIFAFFSKFKNKIIKQAGISILLIAVLIFSHGSTGFSQFGYRFATDFYPLLTFLTIKGVAAQNGPKWYHWLLLILGVCVNLWGIINLNLAN